MHLYSISVGWLTYMSVKEHWMKGKKMIKFITSDGVAGLKGERYSVCVKGPLNFQLGKDNIFAEEVSRRPGTSHHTLRLTPDVSRKQDSLPICRHWSHDRTELRHQQIYIYLHICLMYVQYILILFTAAVGIHIYCILMYMYIQYVLTKSCQLIEQMGCVRGCDCSW